MAPLLPWLIPVPVKKSSFTSLWKSGNQFNIEVNFAGIKNFDASEKEVKNVLESDLQQITRPNISFRLGSGRSGFYRGHYLKGIGRTMLAGNWNDSEDRYHGTGLLNAGGGVREYLSTAYMKSKGYSHSIVPCEHILFQKMSKKTSADFEKIFSDSIVKLDPLIMPLDRSLQAITVKSGTFCRISNLNWLVFRYLNPGSKNVLIEFLSFLTFAFKGKKFTGNESPLDIAKTIENNALHAFDRFIDFHLAGIHWGSYEDNFTLDGRFLDLETPIFYGGPIVGFSLNQDSFKKGEFEFRNVLGMEFLDYLEQYNRFILNLKFRLDFLIEGKHLSKIEMEFAKALSKEIHRMMKNQPLFSSVQDRITIVIEGLSKIHKLDLKSVFKKNKIKIIPQKGVVFTDLSKLRKWDIEFARAEIHELTEVGFLDGYEINRKTTDEAVKWNTTLIEIDHLKKVDQVIHFLRKYPNHSL